MLDCFNQAVVACSQAGQASANHDIRTTKFQMRTLPPVFTQVAPEAYLVPACCFTTAFCLNALTMLFERDGQKFQLAYLGGQ